MCPDLFLEETACGSFLVNHNHCHVSDQKVFTSPTGGLNVLRKAFPFSPKNFHGNETFLLNFHHNYQEFHKNALLHLTSYSQPPGWGLIFSYPWAELLKAGLRQPRVSTRFEFRFESLKSISVLILFVYKLMIESSKYKRENYPRKCFWTQERETRVKR